MFTENKYLKKFSEYEKQQEELLLKDELYIKQEQQKKEPSDDIFAAFFELLDHLEFEKLPISVSCAEVLLDKSGIFHYRNFTSERDGKHFYKAEENVRTGTYTSLEDFGKIIQYSRDIDLGYSGSWTVEHLTDDERIRKSFRVLEKSAESLIKKRFGLRG